ncbi:hypothetical protein F5B21DRAFT_25470 [Xylaria acuta]|nr:hypothetical protein F5B21DRAFT_25470 [Xylaria acuta]
MAILDDVPGIEVIVQVAGTDAVEYDADEEESKSLAESTTCPTVTKYIECTDRVDFAIKIVASRHYAWGYKGHDLQFKLSIDGNAITRRFISGPGKTITINSTTAFCPQSQEWKIYKFGFSAVSTTDDSREERVAQDRELAKHLGLIRIDVRRCIRQPHTSAKARRRLANYAQKFELAEKSMKGKAISHGAAFSSTRSIPAPMHTHSFKLLPEDHGPIAVFHFIYQSKDALQKNLIIPCDAHPSSAQSFDELSPAERERLAKERFEQMQRDRGLKDEAKPILKRSAVKTEDLTKGEENPTPAKRPAEFIDLTID